MAKLDPAWRYDYRTVEYDDTSRGQPLETFIENLKKAAEGLTDPQVNIRGHGDSEYDSSYVEVSVQGSRPKTAEELEREREMVEWQKKRDAEIKEQIAANEKKEFLRLYKKFGKPQ